MRRFQVRVKDTLRLHRGRHCSSLFKAPFGGILRRRGGNRSKNQLLEVFARAKPTRERGCERGDILQSFYQHFLISNARFSYYITVRPPATAVFGAQVPNYPRRRKARLRRAEQTVRREVGYAARVARESEVYREVRRRRELRGFFKREVSGLARSFLPSVR